MDDKEHNGRCKAIFPGSFDPLTLGHIDIITRALELFDTVVVAVLSNPGKKALFSVEERVSLISEEFANFGARVEVRAFSGLLVDFAHDVGSRVVLRGLRAISDYEYEAQMALMNKKLRGEVETLFLMTSAEHSYVSSSLVKQVAPFGGDISHLVSAGVARAVKDKFIKGL